MMQKWNKPKLTNVKPLEMPSNPHTKGDVCAPCLHFLAICLTLWMLHKVKNLMGQDRFTVGCNMCLPMACRMHKLMSISILLLVCLPITYLNWCLRDSPWAYPIHLYILSTLYVATKHLWDTHCTVRSHCKSPMTIVIMSSVCRGITSSLQSWARGRSACHTHRAWPPALTDGQS